jgi:hypothetical protein
MLDILLKATTLVSLISLTVLSPSSEAVSCLETAVETQAVHSKIEELKELKENFYFLQLFSFNAWCLNKNALYFCNALFSCAPLRSALPAAPFRLRSTSLQVQLFF